jgi:hypothetical protein
MTGTAASAPAGKCVRTLSLFLIPSFHDVLGRSACAAISMTRAALLVELEELARMVAGAMRLPAKAAVMGTRVAMRANIFVDVV